MWKKQFAVGFAARFVAVSAVRLIAITTRQGACRCSAIEGSLGKRLMRTPTSATSVARVNGQRRIQNEEKVQQNQHRITTPQLTSLERDGTRYRVQEKCCWQPCRTKTNIFAFVCVQSTLSCVSSSCVHNYLMSIAEPFSFDFDCRG